MASVGVLALSVVVSGVTAGGSASMAATQGSPKPIVYLTFDDGPALDDGSLLVLDVLAKHDVKATFFIVGANVDRKPEQALAMVAAGHTIASHSFSHASLPDLDAAGVRRELVKTQDSVTALGIAAPRCYRPPWGRTNDAVRAVSSSLGLNEVIWSLDSQDWKRQGAEVVKTRLELIGPGENVLLHDGYLNGAQTAEAVDHFLTLHGDEYDFQIVPECVTDGSAPVSPKPEPKREPEPKPEPKSEPTAVDPLGPVVRQPAKAHCRQGPAGGVVDRSDTTSGAVYRLYCSFFGRSPDEAGFGYWSSVLGSSVSLSEASSHFIAGVEFELTYDNLNDSEFLEVVYTNVLGREPDEEGRAFWLGLLANSKTPRERVMLEFSESPEFRIQTGTS